MTAIHPHTIVVHSDKTWTVDHGLDCEVYTPYGPTLICLIHDLAAEQIPVVNPRPGVYKATAGPGGYRLILAPAVRVPA